MIALLMCGLTRLYWSKYSQIAEEARSVMGYTRFLSETEYLNGELMKYLGEHPELNTNIEKTLHDIT